MKERIAIIDSGIGGLPIFNQFIRHITCVTYLADNKFFPYGTKDDIELINILDRIIFYFLNHRYQKVVLACNTASYIYHKYLKYKYKDCVVSIIEDTIDDLNGINHLCNVGIVATNHVVKSNIYSDLIKEKYPVETITLPASELVKLCEENDKTGIEDFIKNHFHVFKTKNIDALILGCTHFNLIEKEISNFFNNQIPIICSGYSLINQFIQNDLCLTCGRNMIYLTDYQKKYIDKIKFLFKDLRNIKIQALNI
ncbi:aspartate/glutamate racemase family protein [Mycoplasmatota bacterium]|nr:aspartate/glutamate racemase family protein [Mycoplasmatota bacterium]